MPGVHHVLGRTSRSTGSVLATVLIMFVRCGFDHGDPEPGRKFVTPSRYLLPLLLDTKPFSYSPRRGRSERAIGLELILL